MIKGAPTDVPSKEGKLESVVKGKKAIPKTHVSEEKKKVVHDLAGLMKKKTVMVVSIKGLPAAQFQDIKKQLRGSAQIQVAKKRLVDFALDHSGVKELHELIPYVQESTALLFSDQDAFEISGILADKKTPARAKEGQEAPEDIEVQAGPTSLMPGPDISALSAVGLIPQVKEGKIHIMQDKILVKKGEIINDKKVAILAKLDITPFENGIEPIAAYDSESKKVYADIKIDKPAFMEEFLEAYSRGLAFAVELNYVNAETLPFVLGKAASHEGAISALIVEGAPAEEVRVEETPKEEEEKPEESVEETKTDEVKADEAATTSE